MTARRKKRTLVFYYIRRSQGVVHYWNDGDGAFRRLCDGSAIFIPSDPEEEAKSCDMCQDIVWRDLFLGTQRLHLQV